MLVMSYFFFFKQKTAYEMRISDWSSDVCSSDLRPRCALAGFSVILCPQPANGHVKAHKKCERNHTLLTISAECHTGIGLPQPTCSASIGDEAQIGRASCRERVCQYV